MAKRAKVLADRDLDFVLAGVVLAGHVAEIEDTRQDYGELRFIAAGQLDGQLGVIVWTSRDGTRRIMPMRLPMPVRKHFGRQRIG